MGDQKKKKFKLLLEKLDEASSDLPWYHKLWYWYVKPVIYNIKSEIVSWPFRIKNGFDYRDTWSLDIATAEWVLPRLKHLHKNLHGYPDGLTFKKWKGYITKMIFALEKVADTDYYFDKKTDKKIVEGLELYGKYFRNLWD